MEEDLAIFYEIHREPEGFQMAVVVPRDEAEFFRHWRETLLLDKEVKIKTVVLGDDVVGDVSSFILEGHRVIGYWIGRKYWGRGIATAAVAEFLALHEKRRPLSAFVAIQNTASYRVLQKCGFQQVGGVAMASDSVEEFRMELV